MSYEQRNALKARRAREGKKRAEQRKREAHVECTRKEPMPAKAHGLISAIHEWARALLGLPRQPSSSSSTQPSATSLLDHHLPTEPTDHEVDTWVNYSSRRSTYLDAVVNRNMDQLLRRTPNLSDSAKNILKTRVTQDAVEAYKKANPPVKFISRISPANSSSATYLFTCLTYAEVALSACGFPRLTFQWTSSLTTIWNMSTLDSMLDSWLQCYFGRKIPPGFTIDPSLDVPKLAKEILSQWVKNKRSLYRQQIKQKDLLATSAGTQHLLKTVRSQKDRAAMRRTRAKVSDHSFLTLH